MDRGLVVFFIAPPRFISSIPIRRWLSNKHTFCFMGNGDARFKPSTEKAASKNKTGFAFSGSFF
jgi:hypothetical protein